MLAGVAVRKTPCGSIFWSLLFLRARALPSEGTVTSERRLKALPSVAPATSFGGDFRADGHGRTYSQARRFSQQAIVDVCRE